MKSGEGGEGIADAGFGITRWWRKQAMVRASARRTAPGSRERGIGASGLEKSVKQGGGDRQRTRGRLEWEAERAGSLYFGYGGARRTSAAGLSSRRPS